MSKTTHLEEGEIMDLDQPTDQIIDYLLKVSIISVFRRRLKLKKVLVSYINSFNFSPTNLRF